MKYHVCPRCGAHLDFGEKCDCTAEKDRNIKELKPVFRTDGRTGQIYTNLDGKGGRHDL